ncbi:ArnT family glycosyltransferase [Pedobacter sp. GR22-6]|uniref:ArnT family glycosyltransferase n=1 Tax=Pedobacter sp. GR22-6 TaxID=3127957 RepID=UPI00307D8633
MLQTSKSPARLLYLFLGIWTLLNVIQASFVELHADEAYYWVYSRFLDWGYFDHPPMVAIFIRIGDALLQNSLGLRLLSVISSTCSLYLLWKILSRYNANVNLFISVFSAVVLFHVYGFITTPDSPLFFFSVLFFYAYQRYLSEDKWTWAILLALVIAGLLYSKYHGILILFFTILSNLKLLKRSSFWMIVILVLALFFPHIWWQVKHNYPSFYYHVIDRNAAFYQFKFTYEYLLAQLALAGPLVGWYFYRSAIKLPATDTFIRALKFNCYGIFVFFLISTLKGRVEAHWTLPAMLCLFMLAYIAMSSREIPKWFNKVTLINTSLILLVRAILIVPVPALMNIKILNYYFGTETWAKQIQEQAGNAGVIFSDSFQVPSRYNYYTRSTRGFGYDSRNYRKNQFDIWPLEDSLRNKRVYYVLSSPHAGDVVQDTIHTTKGDFYGRWIEGLRTYQKMTVNPDPLPLKWTRGAQISLNLKIYNPYGEPVRLGNTGQKWACTLEYGFRKDGAFGDFKAVSCDLESVNIPSGGTVNVPARIVLPDLPGAYKLIFSLRTEPFSGSRNSNMISVEIK